MEKYFLSYVRFTFKSFLVWYLKTILTMRKLILPFLLISVGLFSCKSDKEDLSGITMGNDFYPTEIGKYIVYDYDSVIYDDLLETAIPRTGQVRYEVADTFRDASGRLSYTIKVLSRVNNTDDYISNDVISVTPTENLVEFQQKNLSFIKMVFPVSNGKSWNGNALIPTNDPDPAYKEFDNEAWNYTYANFDTDYQPSAKLYEHTVTVNQIDDVLNDPEAEPSAYAYKNFSKEVYAYNVGLVYKERVYWEFQPKPGGSGFRKGYSVILRAIDNN